MNFVTLHEDPQEEYWCCCGACTSMKTLVLQRYLYEMC